MEERLQKILANAGVTSRRKAEQLIVEGRVTVNGKVITELGTKGDLEVDHIKVDGKLLKHQEGGQIYIALNKPDNVVSTVSDPERRTTVIDLVRTVKARLYPVGRLDYHSTGLILLTNDGDFANAITAARSHVKKTYLVKVTGTLSEDQENSFRAGVPLNGRYTAQSGLRLLRRADNPWYEVTLIEGRNQQIRTMFKHLGFLVEKLRRVRIGNVQLGTLKPGEFRALTPEEVTKLMRIAGQGESPIKDKESPAARKPAQEKSAKAAPKNVHKQIGKKARTGGKAVAKRAGSDKKRRK